RPESTTSSIAGRRLRSIIISGATASSTLRGRRFSTRKFVARSKLREKSPNAKVAKQETRKPGIPGDHELLFLVWSRVARVGDRRIATKKHQRYKNSLCRWCFFVAKSAV